MPLNERLTHSEGQLSPAVVLNLATFYHTPLKPEIKSVNSEVLQNCVVPLKSTLHFLERGRVLAAQVSTEY